MFDERAVPRDNLFRAWSPSLDLLELEARADDDEGTGLGVLRGQFAVFNQWTEIRSAWEGNFMERFAPSSLTKTMKENVARMRVLFNHGHDPQIGDKVLGSIKSLRAADGGATYEVDLFDTSYNRDLEPGLRAGVYGASFRFAVVKDEWRQNPTPSETNPKGLPERTVKEASVAEFGPVTFPAYAGASAGMRSISDRYQIALPQGAADPPAVEPVGDHSAGDPTQANHLGRASALLRVRPGFGLIRKDLLQ